MNRRTTSGAHPVRRAAVVGLCAAWAIMVPLGVAQASASASHAAVTIPAAAQPASSIAVASKAGVVATAASPHGPYNSMRTDACAGCHRAHTAKSVDLLPQASPQSTLCFTCHDGTGASSDVESQYTDPAVTANDPSDPTVTGYTASCTSSDGGTPGSQAGATSPIIVTGLTDGKTYTCTVTATNAVGTGAASAAAEGNDPCHARKSGHPAEPLRRSRLELTARFLRRFAAIWTPAFAGVTTLGA